MMKKNILSITAMVLAVLVLVGGTYYVLAKKYPSVITEKPEFVSSEEALPSEPPEPTTPAPVSSEPEPVKQPDSYATMTFSGDVLIHPSLYKAAKQKDGSYDFKPYWSLMKHVFDSDINMVNMEGPVDVYGGDKSINGYPMFNAPLEILDALRDVNINMLITSNNHTFDTEGRQGCINTRKNIIDKGFIPVGTYETQEQADTPLVMDVNGIKIGMVAFTDSTNGVKIKKEYSGFTLFKITLDDAGIQIIQDKVRRLRDAGAEYVITLFHWGVEYVDEPPAAVVKVTNALAKSGVDLVIGNHSHCVQPIERRMVEYNGQEKDFMVVYSMGNLFVNQSALRDKPKTQYGMIVKVQLKKDSEGRITIDKASYTPTYMYFNENVKTGPDAFRLMVAGEYANAETRPEFFASDADWKKAQKAVDHVKKVVGTEIECKESLKEN